MSGISQATRYSGRLRTREAIERRRQAARDRNRVERHGPDWRGIVAYYNFACATCQGEDEVEIHESFSEVKGAIHFNCNHMMQWRILLCIHCHCSEHNGRFSPKRGKPSLYLEDVRREIAECGSSREAWMAIFGVGLIVGRPKALEVVYG